MSGIDRKSLYGRTKKDEKSKNERISKQSRKSKKSIKSKSRTDREILQKTNDDKEDKEGIGSRVDMVGSTPIDELGKDKLEELLKEYEVPKTDSQKKKGPLYLQKVAPAEVGEHLDLKCEDYFHFFLPEQEVWRIVRNRGDFLVRQSPMDEKEKENDEDEFVICVMSRDRPMTIPINFSKARNFCYINHLSFDKPAGLVQYHYRNHIALDNIGTRLLNPIRKSGIFINHAQIQFSHKKMTGTKTLLGVIRMGFFSRKSVALLDYSNFGYEQGRLEDLYRTTVLARSLNHPNILKHYGIAMSESPVYILTENCTQGTLGYIVRKPNGPDVGKREIFCNQIAKGLQYLHNRFIIHRSIAADHCFVDGQGTVKIGEFGNAIFGAKVKDKINFLAPRYSAPEIRRHRIFSFKSDIWSFGVTMWEVFHNGKTPYEEVADDGKAFAQVSEGTLRLKCISDKYPNNLWKISECCWKSSADERPSIDAIIEQIEKEKNNNQTSKLEKLIDGLSFFD